MLKRGLPPIADSETRIFLLGSLPGDRSLALGRYYGHPTNQFWKIVGRLVDHDLAAMAYEARLQELRKAGIGLWDVVSAAMREGSQDSAIRGASHNPIHGLRDAYPKLEALAFNGGRAASDGRKILADRSPLHLYDLPSSSGLGRAPLVEKIERWSVIKRHLK